MVRLQFRHLIAAPILTLIAGLFLGVTSSNCAAAKQDAKTALDDLKTACASNIPQSVAVLVDPQTGQTVQVVCLTEEELATVLDPVLAKRSAAMHAPAASASASTGY